MQGNCSVAVETICDLKICDWRLFCCAVFVRRNCISQINKSPICRISLRSLLRIDSVLFCYSVLRMRHGFLLIHKPVGPTSHDVVQAVRRRLNEGKIGHLGTLDPAAEGLLVLAVGAKALKGIELFSDLPKEYRAHIHFGATSTTYDREGVIERWSPVAGWHAPDEITIRSIIGSRFLGKIQQVPPAHSAVKIGGRRAYRQG